MSEDTLMELSTNLKRLINEQGMTVSSLSRKTSVSQQTLHNWLSGAEPRSLGQIKRVARFFEVTVDLLCFGESEPLRSPIEEYDNEIKAGLYEVVLRRVNKNKKGNL